MNGRSNRHFNKVIGIGLPKTATSSLAIVLTNNDVLTIHFGSSECDEIREKMYKGIYKFDTLDNYIGITNAFEMIFPQVDKEYPNSKFIYTIREKEAWLNSIELHWKRVLENSLIRPMEIHHHLITFGTYLFNKDRFSYVYDMHSNIIQNYFRDRQQDLLIIDITTDEDYVDKICSFLNITVVNSELIHVNKGK